MKFIFSSLESIEKDSLIILKTKIFQCMYPSLDFTWLKSYSNYKHDSDRSMDWYNWYAIAVICVCRSCINICLKRNSFALT